MANVMRASPPGYFKLAFIRSDLSIDRLMSPIQIQFY